MSEEDMLNELQKELEATKRDFRVVGLELKEEMHLLSVLERIRKFMKKAEAAAKGKMGYGDISPIVFRLDKAISLLKSDKHLDLIITKEDRIEIKELYKDIKLSENKKSQLGTESNIAKHKKALREFRLVNKIEGKKERLEVKHEKLLQELFIIFSELEKYLRGFANRGMKGPLSKMIAEFYGMSNQLFRVVQKERKILKEERKAMS